MTDVPLKVLLVEDTAVYRRILRRVIDMIPNCEVAGTAANGKIALSRLAEIPVDIVLLDVEMPEMGGLETLGRIKERYPEVGVIMVSGINKDAASITIEALEMGALDFVSKPVEGDAEAGHQKLLRHLKRLITLHSTQSSLRAIAEVTDTSPAGVVSQPSVNGHAPAKPVPAQVDTPKRSAPSGRIDLVVVGISTGGPKALAEFLPGLPADLGVPVLLVQHMPPAFTASLAESLSRKSRLPIQEAKEGDSILPNHVYIAPGGKHMVVRRQPGGGPADHSFCVGLNRNPPENHCRPSVDVLFRSVAAHYGRNVLAVVMTGMGDDGMKGVKVLKRNKCYCLTQSEASCVVYGMPRAVDMAGLSDESVPLARLANRVTRLVRDKVLS